MNQEFQPLIDGIKVQIAAIVESIKTDPRLESLKKLQSALNNLEAVAGVPKTSLSALLSFDADDSENVSTTLSVSPHEFFGLEPLEAAKKYLRKVGPVRKSAHISDIIRAIHDGGGDPGPEDKLRVSLARSTFEVAKIGEDRFGLLEYFPHIKRGTPGRKKKTDAAADASGSAVDSADDKDGTAKDLSESESPGAEQPEHSTQS